MELALDSCSKSLLFSDGKKLQAAKGISWEFLFSWTKSLIVRVTESRPKLRNHSKPTLETKKIMLRHCKLKVCELRMQIKFWLTVSTNRDSTVLCYKKNAFFPFRTPVWMCKIVIVREFSSKTRWFFFFVVAIRLSFKTMCTIWNK